MTQNQLQFESTIAKLGGLAHLSERAIKISTTALSEVTGMGAFCFLSPGGPPSNSGMLLAVMNSSDTLPVTRCRVIIFKLPPDKSTEAEMRQAFNPVAIEELGSLIPGKNSGRLTNVRITPGKYYIQIETRNESFFEFLTLNPIIDKPQGPLFTCQVKDKSQKEVGNCGGG